MFRSRFPPSRCFSFHLSRPRVSARGEISWKICRIGFIRCRSSRLTRSCVCLSVFHDCYFFAFCREAKSTSWTTIALVRSTGVASQNKSDAMAVVSLSVRDDWYFFFFFRARVLSNYKICGFCPFRFISFSFYYCIVVSNANGLSRFEGFASYNLCPFSGRIN